MEQSKELQHLRCSSGTLMPFDESLSASLRGVPTYQYLGSGPSSGLSSVDRDRPFHRPRQTRHSCDNGLCVCRRVAVYHGVKGEVC